MTDPAVARIVVDLRANRLTLELDPPLPRSGETAATIDIGAFGRLIGIEVTDAGSTSNPTYYLAIADPAPDGESHLRSVEVAVDVAGDGQSLTVPRRGVGWEISFPSGNQCWTRAGGSGSLCSVLAGTR